MELSPRQEWKVMRDLVSENNNIIKNIFSSAVSASIYDSHYRGSTPTLSKATIENLKQARISRGIREVYKAAADNFFVSDYYGSKKCLDLQDAGKNWIDQLSTTDLFYYYAFQSKIIKKFNNEENLNATTAVRIIDGTSVSKYFSGKVEFSGKPDKTPEDKTKIDVKDLDVRAQVLHDLTLREHQKYCERNNLDPSQNEETIITGTNFGKYSGVIASRYFKQKEFLAAQRQVDEQLAYDQMVLEDSKPVLVGYDDQFSPLYQLPDGSYKTSIGSEYSGDIYKLVDDEFVYTGSTDEVVFEDPTDESDLIEQNNLDTQMSLFKRDVEISAQTQGSESVQ